MPSNIRIENFPLKDETDLIIGIGIEIYKILGFGFSEIVYKDVYQYEFKQRNNFYEREKEYEVTLKTSYCPISFMQTSLSLIKLYLN